MLCEQTAVYNTLWVQEKVHTHIEHIELNGQSLSNMALVKEDMINGLE